MPPCGESRRDTGRLSEFRPVLGPRSYENSHAGTYLNCHILEAVPCILHDFAKTEYGAEGIRLSIINARLEVGGGDVGEDVSPLVREETESEQGQPQGEAEVLFERLVNTLAWPLLTC